LNLNAATLKARILNLACTTPLEENKPSLLRHYEEVTMEEALRRFFLSCMKAMLLREIQMVLHKYLVKAQ
jgi:hypothetical protein